TAVSVANTCPYCVDVHGAAVTVLGQGRDFPEVTAWVDGTGPVPGEPDDRPELVGVAVTFHYLTRMVNVFLPNSPLPPGLPRGPGLAVLGRFLRDAADSPIRPCDSLALLPTAPLPA